MHVVCVCFFSVQSIYTRQPCPSHNHLSAFILKIIQGAFAQLLGAFNFIQDVKFAARRLFIANKRLLRNSLWMFIAALFILNALGVPIQVRLFEREPMHGCVVCDWFSKVRSAFFPLLGRRAFHLLPAHRNKNILELFMQAPCLPHRPWSVNAVRVVCSLQLCWEISCTINASFKQIVVIFLNTI